MQPSKFPPKITALRWSWVHWWEANRELYIQLTGQGRHRQDSSASGLDAPRSEASAGLLETLNDPDIVPRLAAAQALGRIGGPAAEGVLDKLAEVAESDPREHVRLRALLSIGMIGGDESEPILGGYEPKTQRLRAASLIAMGFLPAPSDLLRDHLEGLLADPSPTVRAAAQWALAQQPGGLTGATAINRIVSERSPWLVSVDVLVLGPSLSERGVRVLSAIVTGDDVAEGWAAWKLLESVRRDKLGQREVVRYSSWVDAHRRLHALNPTPIVDLPDYLREDGPGPVGESLREDERERHRPRNQSRLEMVRGIEEIYQARLRSSAAIALGDAGDRQGVVESLQRLTQEREDDYNVQPKCFALISLGQIGAKKGLADLLEVLSDRDGRRPKPQKVLESPQRGFAAIGLGLYARSYDSPQGLSDRPGYEKAIELLTERLMDKREKLEVRSACAVALGLSGRTSNLKTLIGGYSTFDDASPLLGGYVLLGRGLLGDRNLIEPVVAAIERKPYHDETTDLLARRAAVLSLGVAGTSESIPVLVSFYDEPYYVNREVILALSLCGAEGVSSQVLPGLTDGENQYERAYMAEIVGRLLSRGEPPALSRFLIGSNFTVKNGLLEPYRRMGNPFLYDYLIPQFESKWY